MLPLVAITGIATLIGGIVYAAWNHQKKRTLALQELAERLGWSFQPKPDLDAVTGYGRLQLFSQGRRQQVRNHLAGEREGRQVAVFDYSYVTGGGNSQATWHQTVVHVHVPEQDLPAFALRPEHVLHKIGAMFGYQDIDIENDPVFSGQYLLRGTDEAAIRALFDADVRDFFDRNPRSSAEAAGPDVFFWRTQKLAKPGDVDLLMDAGIELARRLARHAALPRGG